LLRESYKGRHPAASITYGAHHAQYHSRYIADPGLDRGFPAVGYSSGWGYGPSGILGVILIVVLILALTGRV
jgi:hypothetical protein